MALVIHRIYLYLQENASEFTASAERDPKPPMNPLTNNAKTRKDGQPNHLTPLKQDIAPNAIRLALGVLFPWSAAANSRGRKRYPGIYAGALALLGGRAKVHTLKDWCSGRRNAPRWFVGFLDAELAERQRLI